MIILFLIIQFAFPSVAKERWLIQIAEKSSHCIDVWWQKNSMDERSCLKNSLPVENWFVVEIPNTLLSSFKRLPCVIKIVPDLKLQPHTTYPNDPLYVNQTNMDLIGMTKAWDISTGGFSYKGETIVIAVIDDGFQLDHEDLKDNLWHNPKEIENDGIDNDGNGYVDDYYGVSIPTKNGNHPYRSHGTSVCGILSATGNNEVGIAGVNWEVKILLISYDNYISSLVEAYQYILTLRNMYNESNGTEGAFIVVSNLSSGLLFGRPEYYPLWCGMYDLLGEAGVLSVCSTSNFSHSVDKGGDLPALCPSPYTIIVTNVDTTDQIAHNAGYGRISVDIGAPGEKSLTTDTNNSYPYFRGSSAAAPYVSGTVALMYSVNCPNYFQSLNSTPSETAIRIKNTLLSSGMPNKSLQNITLTGKRLQTDAALERIQSFCDTGIETGVSVRFVTPNPVRDEIRLYLEFELEYLPRKFSVITINGIRLINGQLEYIDYLSGYATINVSSLPSGEYFILFEEGPSKYIYKFIKLAY